MVFLASSAACVLLKNSDVDIREVVLHAVEQNVYLDPFHEGPHACTHDSYRGAISQPTTTCGSGMGIDVGA